MKKGYLYSINFLENIGFEITDSFLIHSSKKHGARLYVPKDIKIFGSSDYFLFTFWMTVKGNRNIWNVYDKNKNSLINVADSPLKVYEEIILFSENIPKCFAGFEEDLFEIK